jgi:TPR repeat protein
MEYAKYLYGHNGYPLSDANKYIQEDFALLPKIFPQKSERIAQAAEIWRNLYADSNNSLTYSEVIQTLVTAARNGVETAKSVLHASYVRDFIPTQYKQMVLDYIAEECESEHNTTACLISAKSLYFEEEGVVPDHKKAAKHFAIACDNGKGELMTCKYAASAYTEIKQYDLAKKYNQILCNTDNASGCKNVGVFYIEGMGVDKDYSKAFA